jgi:endo-1,4-beta-xylanase
MLPLQQCVGRLLCAALLFLGCGAANAQQPPAQPPGNPPARPPVQAGQRRAPAKAEWIDSDHNAPNGTLYKTFASKTLGHDVSYLIYLPPDYDKDAKRYPVIYWLHGMGANQRGGAQMYVPHVTAAVQEGIMPPAIIVLVNGMVKSFYCDSVDGQVPMETVVTKELIPHIDQTYRTLAKREDRLIEGYSMGGFGAAHLGFKYPELFGTVVINAGALIDPSLPLLMQIFGNDPQKGEAEHPMQLVRQNADKLRGHTHIRIGCGALDTLLTKNKALHELLDELKIPHDFEVVPDVAHESPRYYQLLGTKVYEFHRKSLEAFAKAD